MAKISADEYILSDNHTWIDETYRCQQIHDNINLIERLRAHTPAEKAEQIRYTVYQYENTCISKLLQCRKK